MWLKKNRRKGFTIVELIVVLGIIGVLTAIILPMLVGSGKPQAANAKAKSFYYSTQSVFMDYKTSNPDITEKTISGTPTLSDSYFTVSCGGVSYGAYFDSNYYFIEAQATANEGFTKVTVALHGDTDPTEYQYKCLSATLSQDSPSTYRRQEFTSGAILDAYNGFSTKDDYGYYYALVDWQCRVVATYWSDEPLSVLSDDTTGEFSKQTIQFIDNNKIDYTYVGAFPETRGAVGDLMFKV